MDNIDDAGLRHGVYRVIEGVAVSVLTQVLGMYIADVRYRLHNLRATKQAAREAKEKKAAAEEEKAKENKTLV